MKDFWSQIATLAMVLLLIGCQQAERGQQTERENERTREFFESADYPAKGITHTVQAGETLAQIARMHGSQVAWIVEANDINNEGNRSEGLVLFIPLEPKQNYKSRSEYERF